MSIFSRLRDFFRGSGNRRKDASQPVTVDWDADWDAVQRRNDAFAREYLDSPKPGGPLSAVPLREWPLMPRGVRQAGGIETQNGDTKLYRDLLRQKDPQKGLDPQKVSRGTLPADYFAQVRGIARGRHWYPPGFVPPINLKPRK